MRASWGKNFSLLISLFIFKLDLFIDVRRERANVFNMLRVIMQQMKFYIQSGTSAFVNEKASETNWSIIPQFRHDMSDSDLKNMLRQLNFRTRF